MLKLESRKKYKDALDGTIRTGAGWRKFFQSVVKIDKMDGMLHTDVDYYIDLYTDGSSEHMLKPIAGRKQ